MAERYVQDPRATILIVSSATEIGICGDRSFGIARRIDPMSLRTLCAITKIDIMDPG